MLEQYLSSLKPTTNKQDQAEAVRQASLNGWGGGTYSQLIGQANKQQVPVEYSAVATGYAPMENTKTNYSDKYLAALQPVFQAQEAKKADLKRTYQDNKDRIREVEDIIKKYTDEAIKAQGESRQAKTLSTAAQALTAERRMGQEKAGREQALIKNLGSQGAIGTTGAVDIASAGIGAEYEGNLDELQSRRVTRMGEINDLYLSESDRINKEYANDQQKLKKELADLDKEYDEAVNAIDIDIATKKSDVALTAMEKEDADNKANRDLIAKSFLDQVARGAYNTLGDEGINKKALELFGDDINYANSIAFQARALKGSLNDPTAMSAKADEIITALATSGSNDRFTGAMAEEIKRRVLAGEDATILLAEYKNKSRTLPRATGSSSADTSTTLREVVLGYDEDMNPIKATQVWQNGVPLYTVDANGNIIPNESEVEVRPLEETVQPKTQLFKTVDDVGFKPTLGVPNQNVYYDTKAGVSRNQNGEVVKYINGQWVVQKPLA